MKTNTSDLQGQQGNVLLLTIVVTGLIGFVLVAYLSLVQNQNQANARSQTWNSVMPVVEAGIEDALAHLNARGEGSQSLRRDGWTQSGDDFMVKRGIGEDVYIVRIRNYVAGRRTNSPTIESVGYVAMPTLASSGSGSGPLLASLANPRPGVHRLARGVRVETRQEYLFSKGMVAKDGIDMNGNNVRTDSFDSRNPLYSTNGLYDASRARDNGDIAVNSSMTNSLDVGNADIRGRVSVGPGGMVRVGSGGAVGSSAWHEAGNTGIEDGYSSDDMNVSFPAVKPPFNGGAQVPTAGWITNISTSFSLSTNVSKSYVFPAGCVGTVTSQPETSSIYPVGYAGTVTTNYGGGGKIASYTYSVYACAEVVTTSTSTTNVTHYDYILEDGDYQLAVLDGTVYVKGDAVLYVTEDMDMESLWIEGGDSLNVYVAAESVKFSGNSNVNSPGSAESLSYWGLPSNQEVKVSGNANFTGTIYAPNADIELKGSGSGTTLDFSGASISRTVRLTGHFNFHYDEALGRYGPFRGYIVTSWNEMAPSELPGFSTRQTVDVTSTF